MRTTNSIILSMILPAVLFALTWVASNVRAEEAAGRTDFDVTDRIAIINLLNSYSYDYDEHRIDSWLKLFSEDAEVEFRQAGKPAKTVRGFESLKTFFSARSAAFRESSDQRRHLVTNVVVDEQLADIASGRVYMLVASTQSDELNILAAGRYDLNLVKRDGTWRIQKWTISFDSSFE